MVIQSTASGGTGIRKGMVLVHGAGHFIPTDAQFVEDKIAGFVDHGINFRAAFYTDVPNSPFNDAVAHAVALRNEFLHTALLATLAALPTPTLVGAFATLSPDLLHAALTYMTQPGTPLYNLLAQYTVPGPVQQAFSQLQTLMQVIPGQSSPAQPAGTAAANTMDINCVIWEVLHYLFDPNTNQRLRALVQPTIDEAVAECDEVVLVSHSLGTVISYDILRNAPATYKGKISNWFTLGCPLGKVASAIPTFQQLGNISYYTVKRWYNFYAAKDLVASPIGPVLAREQSYLIHDVFMDFGADPLAAHDYLHNDETLIYISQTMI